LRLTPTMSKSKLLPVHN